MTFCRVEVARHSEFDFGAGLSHSGNGHVHATAEILLKLLLVGLF